MHIGTPICLSPLAALPLLRRLSIVMEPGTELTDAQVAELRALPRLETLHVSATSTSLLRRLLARPHDLQWQQISLPQPLRQNDAALLPQLPSLTALSWTAHAQHLDSLDFLQRLPNLVSIHCFHCDGLVAQLTAALQHCTNVTELALDCCDDITAAHLADLLPRLPRLQSLLLFDLTVDSLSFLAQAPLTSQLSRLVLSFCTKLPVAELRHVHSLLGLREMDIFGSFDEPMDPDCAALAALRPPSAALPLLESFTYTPPRIMSVQ